MTYKYFLAAPLFLALCACSEDEPKDVFYSHLQELCGKSFEGKVISTDEVDADFAKERLIMHVNDCASTTTRIPFHVGDDHSRTWVITNSADGLTLKHDHRHEDGTEDAVSQYGGTTGTAGSTTRQEFPVDQYSIDMFKREGLDASVVNVWAIDLVPGKTFTYELSRPNRLFQAEFDLSKPIK